MRTATQVRLSNHAVQQAMSVSNPRPRTREILVRNLKTLMDLRGMSQRELATTSGVSQGQLSAILNDKSACSIETAEALARAFDLHGWHLLLHNLPKELVDSPKVGQMVEGYLKLNGEGREFIDAAIRRETSRKR